MAVNLTYQPIPEGAFDLLLDTFNRGYEGYMIPLRLDESQLRGHITGNSIDLSASRLAYDGDHPVGVALLGIRGKRGWVGGMGVKTAYRGRGIGRGLMLALLVSARERVLETVQLEVIHGNTAAYTLYRSLGFQEIRRLLVIERPASPIQTKALLDVQPAPASYAVPSLPSLRTLPPPWQREPDSLTSLLDRLNGWQALDKGCPLAFAVGFTDEKGIIWMDMAGDPPGIQAIAVHVHAVYPGAAGRFVNLGEDDPAWAILSELGYVEKMAQHEMRLAL